jgi:hypothetical protein
MANAWPKTVIEQRRYPRGVFDGLRKTLDVRISGDTAISTDDCWITPNYDIRSDGAWLKEGQALDQLEWTPECELEDGRPLSQPALPFPFSARHFAAFVLGGWGWYLGARLGLVSDPYDPAEEKAANDQALKVLLGSLRDVEPREVVTAARQCLEDASGSVGGSYLKLRETELAARTALQRAVNEGQPPSSVAKLLTQRTTAERAVADAWPGWRKAMVNTLLPRSTQRRHERQSLAVIGEPEPERMKRSIFINSYRRDWPGVEAHLKSAHRNGLREVAHAGKGFWYVESALGWARERGHFKAIGRHGQQLASRVHRLKD